MFTLPYSKTQPCSSSSGEYFHLLVLTGRSSSELQQHQQTAAEALWGKAPQTLLPPTTVTPLTHLPHSLTGGAAWTSQGALPELQRLTSRSYLHFSFQTLLGDRWRAGSQIFMTYCIQGSSPKFSLAQLTRSLVEDGYPISIRH